TNIYGKTENYWFFLCKEDYCVYLRDVTQSAALLASHRSGGFHRLMHSVAARTSYIKRFCKISTSSNARSKLRKAAGPLAVIAKKQRPERLETKKGVKVPESLAKTLQESKELKNAWDKLRPSCQREYVERVNKAKSEEKRKEKIDRIIELTLDYAKRHPEKYKNRKS